MKGTLRGHAVTLRRLARESGAAHPHCRRLRRQLASQQRKNVRRRPWRRACLPGMFCRTLRPAGPRFPSLLPAVLTPRRCYVRSPCCVQWRGLLLLPFRSAQAQRSGPRAPASKLARSRRSRPLHCCHELTATLLWPSCRHHRCPGLAARLPVERAASPLTAGRGRGSAHPALHLTQIAAARACQLDCPSDLLRHPPDCSGRRRLINSCDSAAAVTYHAPPRRLGRRRERRLRHAHCRRVLRC